MRYIYSGMKLHTKYQPGLALAIEGNHVDSHDFVFRIHATGNQERTKSLLACILKKEDIGTLNNDAVLWKPFKY